MTSSPKAPILPDSTPSDQGLGVHQFPAGGVDEDHPVLHFFEALPVHHMAALLIERHVEGENVAFCKNLLQRDILGNPLQLLAWIGVISQDLAPKPGEIFRHRPSDVPSAHNTHCQAAQLPPLEPVDGVVVDPFPAMACLAWRRHISMSSTAKSPPRWGHRPLY